ncbi:thioesterase family protein [Desulfuromonas carbonis]|uniref:acyl-CoA thioesterase n=1 Tax=Desulfuromonas sp. DDH964 TaxID=1823759 RepID=UPI00078B7DAC|nr:thioesterase family protein [Desulfuromonas sp. DDH964]AMV72031.1 acyl-CoA thioesterase [Desulfuromonas sp. DDH964]
MTRSMSLTVRYAETDAQGIVHHSRYLIWFEEGRSDFLRQQGLHYRDFEKAGYFIVVAEAEVKYRAPALYEDVVTVETTLVRMRGKVIEFSYRASNEAGTLLAEGRTRHVVLGPDRRPTPLPDSLLEAIGVPAEVVETA